MSYKFSKGSTVQGDIKAADDAERNTLIDFGEDQIEFQTSGSTRLKVDNTGIIVTGSVEITQSSDQEMLRFSKTDGETAEMVFEMGGNDLLIIACSDKEVKDVSMHDLLPYGFRLERL